MYSLDLVYFLILGIMAIIFGFASPNIFLIFGGAALALFGFYIGKDKSPKVLDTSKYKRRFMTDNSMAYVAIDGSKKDNRYGYGYIAYAVFMFLIAMFSHNFIAIFCSACLACASVIMAFSWVFRGDTDVFWMPGESRPVRIFYNENKFKPDESEQKEEKETVEIEVVDKEEKK